MPWARLEEGFPEHHKVVGLSDGAFRSHISAICYVSRTLTDGRIPRGALRSLGASPARVKELLAAHVWDEQDGELFIHDYLEYNPSRAEVMERRSKKQAAGQAGGQARAKALAQAKVVAKSKPDPDPDPDPDNPSETTSPQKESARKRATRIDREFIEELVFEWKELFRGEEKVRFAIERAMNGKAYREATDKRQSVRNWLRLHYEDKYAPNGNENTGGKPANIYSRQARGIAS